MRSHRLPTLGLALVAATIACATAAPAQACAQTAEDPCLRDPDATVVTGTVFTDRAGDGGARADGDPGLPGYLVWLDRDGDSVRDGDEPSTRTVEDGTYELDVDVAAIEGLQEPPVRVAPQEQGCTFPVPCNHRPLLERGVPVEGADFGLVRTAHLRMTVWEDADEDGRRAAGVERIAVGAPLYVDENGNDQRDPGEPRGAQSDVSEVLIPIPPRLLGRELTLRMDEPQGWVCTAPRTCEDLIAPLQSGEYRNVGEWTVAKPIIIFVHGFLGSEIACQGTGKLWVTLPRAKLPGMRLAGDGRTNLPAADGGDGCTETAGPNGNLIRNVAGADIYGVAEDHYRSLAAPRRYGAIAWDWRKDPMSQVDVLDRYIEDLRCDGQAPCSKPVADKVVLVGHSQGGLLSRAYIADPDRAKKVRRLVTLGTPTWGSPKAIFPSIAGVETPVPSGMDALLSNTDLKTVARNFAGGIALLPSAAYGPWLQVPQWRPGTLAADQVADFLDATGNNGLLARQAARNHQRVWDSYANGSLNGVPYEVLVGGGVPTIDAVRFEYGLEPRVVVGMGDGDGTVPLRSAEFDTPAEHLHRTCKLDHITLTAAAQTVSTMDRFIQRGRPPREPDPGTTCFAYGRITQVVEAGGVNGFELTAPTGLKLTDPVTGQAAAAPRPATVVAGGRRMPIAEAEAKGLVDVLGFGRQRFFVTDDRTPVTLEVPVKDAVVTTRTLAGDREGPERRYGPVSGALTVRTGDGTMAAGGKALKPARRLDREAPRTRATVTRLRGGRLRVALKAKDASEVRRYLVTGTRRRAYRRPVVLPAKQAARTRFASVDRWGNAERLRRLPRAGG